MVAVAGLLLLLGRQKRPHLQPVSWLLMALASIVGLILPSLVYWEVRPFASEIMQVPLGYGPGFWLNLLGHALILILATAQLAKK